MYLSLCDIFFFIIIDPHDIYLDEKGTEEEKKKEKK